MTKQALIPVAILCLALTVAIPVIAQDHSDVSARAMAYILSGQNQDGGFTNGFAPESDITATADVIVAAVVADEDPNGFFVGTMMNPLSYLGVQIQAGNVTGAGQIAKVVTAVAAVGKDPAAFAGHDLVVELNALEGDDGLFGMGAFDHCLAMIALQNAGVALSDRAVGMAIALQDDTGGWGFMAGEAPDTNTTGVCVQALAPTTASAAVDAALDYLLSIQNEDGGWPYQNPSDFGTESDSNSTALVIQALVAAGENLAEWGDPHLWLADMQLENGAFAFQAAFPDANVLATIAAVPAMEGVPLNAWRPEPEAE